MLTYNVIEISILIYFLTATLKPFEMIIMTDQFITQIPIKSVTNLTLKQLLLTCIFTLQFIVLYCFFFGHTINNLIQRWKKTSVDPKELLLLKNQGDKQEENTLTHNSAIQSTTITPLITKALVIQEKQEIPIPPLPSSKNMKKKPPTIIHNTFKPTQHSQLLHYAMAEKIQLPEVVTDSLREKKTTPLSASPSFIAMMAPLSHPVPEIELFLSSQSMERLPPLSPPRSGSLSPSSSVASSESVKLKSRFHAVMQKGESRLSRFTSLRRDKKDIEVKPSLSSKLHNKLKKSGKGLSKMFAVEK